MRIFTLTLIFALLRCTTPPVPAPEAKPKAPMTTNTANATITITGVATSEGVECPAVRGDDGKLYTIVGTGREKLTPGVRVKITGTIAQMSTCMQGTTISATAIEVLRSAS